MTRVVFNEVPVPPAKFAILRVLRAGIGEGIDLVITPPQCLHPAGAIHVEQSPILPLSDRLYHSRPHSMKRAVAGDKNPSRPRRSMRQVAATAWSTHAGRRQPLATQPVAASRRLVISSVFRDVSEYDPFARLTTRQRTVRPTITAIVHAAATFPPPSPRSPIAGPQCLTNAQSDPGMICVPMDRNCCASAAGRLDRAANIGKLK